MNTTVRLLLPGILMTAIAAVAESAPPPHARLTVHNTPLHAINPQLFGQFLERPCGGEKGPEPLADSETGRLPPRILEMLKDMRIPVIRFPAGTDIDYTDWRDMISNVPGRASTRGLAGRPLTYGKANQPVSNRFGYDEYFTLQAELGCATILPVNLRGAFLKKVPLNEAAQLAAGLVAYVNAPVGATLPEGMPDWPAVRARNGHPAPYRVRYFQLGNEAWMFVPKGLEELRMKDDPAAAAAWLAECYTSFGRAMRAVDPDIELIIDGNMSNNLAATVLADPRIRELKPLVTRHCYAPGPLDVIWQGPTRKPSELSPRDWWYSWTGMPGYFDAQGQCLGPGPELQLARTLGYKSVCTEWNWVGFGFGRLDPQPELNFRFASALGAAGFIHGMLRNADELVLATQSMLLGCGWNFAAIHAESATDPAPYYSPQAVVTTFYNHHHGNQLLRSEIAGVATYPQPFQFGWGPQPSAAVGILDLLATADAQCLYIHAINRDMTAEQQVDVELRGFPARAAAGTITHRCLTGDPQARPDPAGIGKVIREETRRVPTPTAATLTLILPPHSVSVFQIPR